MTQKTALNAAHRAGGGKMVDFAGWDMPLHYGSQKDEHHRAREDAGMFDVSHMTVIDFDGEDARAFLRGMLANDVARMDPPAAGAEGDTKNAPRNAPKNALKNAMYSCMLREDGGVLDDLIVYRRAAGQYRLVVNAATTAKDVAWLRQHLDDGDYDARMTARDDLAIVAVQGPNARAKAAVAVAATVGAVGRQLEALPPFCGADFGAWFIARTGYTGEDGFEVMLPSAAAAQFWHALAAAGVHMCGLGARDTLRLEAGMNLYGQDMDETVSPLQCGLGWTVAWRPEARDFIGRAALQRQKAAGNAERFVGVLLAERGVMRGGQKVFTAAGAGVLTSGGFSPTLNRSIGLARVPRAASGDDCEVEVRGRRLRATIVKPPFVRNGTACIELGEEQ